VRPGDSIYIQKIGGRKKIGDYFTDTKTPRYLRAQVPLLALGGDILWVMDKRGLCSDRYLATAETALKLYVHVWEDD
jgi:tRNA(Ile)-lysidine synthetase-like protein